MVADIMESKKTVSLFSIDYILNTDFKKVNKDYNSTTSCPRKEECVNVNVENSQRAVSPCTSAVFKIPEEMHSSNRDTITDQKSIVSSESECKPDGTFPMKTIASDPNNMLTESLLPASIAVHTENAKVESYSKNCTVVSDGLEKIELKWDMSKCFLRKNKTKRCQRIRFSHQQLSKLEEAFESSHYLTVRKRAKLSETLELTETQIKVWFQNRRAKEKRVEESECERMSRTTRPQCSAQKFPAFTYTVIASL